MLTKQKQKQNHHTQAKPARRKRTVVTRSKVNFSIEEAAVILGYTFDQTAYLLRTGKIRSYRRPEWFESRVTIYDLHEYSYLSGRRLAI